MSDYAKRTVADLTEILKGRGLPHSGKKAELIARLQENDKSAEATAPDSVAEPAPAPVETPPQPVPEPASKPTPAPAEPAKLSEPAPLAEPAAPSPDTALAATTNYALNLPTESLDEEAARRKKRAERFGLSTPANGEVDSEGAKKAERAKKFGTGEGGLGKLNEALPMDRERGPKRRKEGEDATLDDPALIRRRGGRGRGGFRGGGFGRGAGGNRGGRRQGTPDRPSGVQKPAAYTSDRDRAAAEARRKRFAQAS